MRQTPPAIAAIIIAALLLPSKSQAQSTDVSFEPQPLVLEQKRAVTSLDLDVIGHQLISSGLDGAVRIWKLPDGERRRVLFVHSDDVYEAKFSRDGKEIISTGGDGKVLVLDATTGRVRLRWQFPTWCAGLDLLAGSRVAVDCADLKIRILDLHTGRIEREL